MPADMAAGLAEWTVDSEQALNDARESALKQVQGTATAVVETSEVYRVPQDNNKLLFGPRAQSSAPAAPIEVKLGVVPLTPGNVVPYARLAALLKGTGLQAHHLIEKRFADVLGLAKGHMPAVPVTPAQHQVFTSAWRSAIAYGKGTATATRGGIKAAAESIYADYPWILNALRPYW